ncbi:hypothetical protein FACS1894140_0100 [Spirochaetia bacterium]|nr:hypothetical protein FACS1894140_0100 [Spirochaetia bacterium]
MERIPVAIIGLGRIASLLEDDERREKPCTHAGAIAANPDCRLIAGADTAEDRRRLFAERWNVPVYADAAAMLAKHKPGILVIATHPDSHARYCRLAAAHGVPVVICEKPLADGLRKARVKYSLAQRRNRDEARVQAGLLFAAKTANELKQYVITGAGQDLNDRELDIVEEIATATKITITGNESVADFWQLVETEDLTTHQKTQEYLWYIVYSMPDATWKALVRKYTNDIIGQLPDRAVQTKVAQAFSDIEAEATREREQTEAEFKAQNAAQLQKARADARLAEARVNQQTVANAQAQATERAEITASASAQRAALRSGKPEEVAVASTSSGDIDWISALGTAAKVVF